MTHNLFYDFTFSQVYSYRLLVLYVFYLQKKHKGSFKTTLFKSNVKVLCYLQFLKNHKICLNRIKSLLVVNSSNVISENDEDFPMERRYVI